MGFGGNERRSIVTCPRESDAGGSQTITFGFFSAFPRSVPLCYISMLGYIQLSCPCGIAIVSIASEAS